MRLQPCQKKIKILHTCVVWSYLLSCLLLLVLWLLKLQVRNFLILSAIMQEITLGVILVFHQNISILILVALLMLSRICLTILLENNMRKRRFGYRGRRGRRSMRRRVRNVLRRGGIRL